MSAELFAISPGRGDRAELSERLPALARGGVRRFLLREKHLDRGQRAVLLEALLPLCAAEGIECWLSEDLELAARFPVAGVQLGERCPAPSTIRVRGRELPLGVSLHAPCRRAPAELRLCQHAFVAPLFATPSKPGAECLGLAGLEQFCRQLPASLTTYALGGITAARLPELAAAGVRRIAAIRLFFEARDPEAAARHALACLQGDPPK